MSLSKWDLIQSDWCSFKERVFGHREWHWGAHSEDHVKMHGEESHCKPSREVSEETWPADTLILDFELPQLRANNRHFCDLGSPGKWIHLGNRESGHKPEEPLTCSWQTQSCGQPPERGPQRGFGIRASPRGQRVRRWETRDEGWGSGRRSGWIPEPGPKLLAGMLNALSRLFVHVEQG